jgi:hypothetical protein
VKNTWLEAIERKTIPGYSRLSEEEQSFPPLFVEESNLELVEQEEEQPVEVKTTECEVYFEAFLDGVQRTVLWRRAPLSSGAVVPIHIAHIAAGVMLRDQNGRLYVDPELVASRTLLLAPFTGLKEAGLALLEDNPPEFSDTSERTFKFPSVVNEWLLCDTTFCGTEPDRDQYTEGALLGLELLNEGKVRSRAQGRVATLRQRLEMAVLARFRAKYPTKWILVDGPLFFIDKWRRRAATILGEELGRTDSSTIEDQLLSQAVGLIKSHRLRPKHLETVLKIGPSHRSLVSRLTNEVDIKGRRDSPDEDGSYGGAHLTWYTRLRGHTAEPYGILGLIRLDVHRATFGIDRVDSLEYTGFKPYSDQVDAITRAVWRERWPAIRDSNELRAAAEPYPIQQLEKVLHAMLMPRRYLSHLRAFVG